MRIALVFGNDGTDVRIGKVCRSLSAMGHDVHLVGWDRRPELPKERDLGSAKTHFFVYPTSHGRGSLSGELRFTRYVYGQLARLRPHVACTVNEDRAFSLLPLKGIFYRHLVCDVFDALVDRHSHRPWLVRVILRLISESARSGADRLIATDEVRHSRFGRFRRKTEIVCNYPEDPGDDLWRKFPTGPAKVYVSGTLNRARGLEQVLQAVERLDNVEVISAGWAYDDYSANVFVKHPKVTFKGIVTSRDSLELAAGCDAVLALYAPTSTNNRLASPNKIYDAMSVGRPVIVNSEIGVAKWVVENKIGWACPYADVSALEGILSSLAEHREELCRFGKYVRQAFTSRYTWGRMEERLRALYGGFERRDRPRPKGM